MLAAHPDTAAQFVRCDLLSSERVPALCFELDKVLTVIPEQEFVAGL
jgi:hypothetical protein